MATLTCLFKNVARRSASQAFRLHALAPCATSVRFTSYFTPAHEYAKVDGKVATCGITDFAQAALGDIVFIDLPEVGAEYQKGESFGSVESVKAASDVYAPVSGTVVAINEALSDEPGIVNKSPEDKGWFIKIEMSKTDELSDLMQTADYKAHCEKEAH